jgi:hypothetical protein
MSRDCRATAWHGACKGPLLMRHAISSLLVGTVLAAIGCGSDPEQPAASQSVSSEQARFKGTFVADPAPAIVGNNRLEATLTTADDDAPLVAAALAVQPWMPAHGHGSASVPKVVEREQGRYEIDEIVYTMAGQWELRIEVTAGGVEDRFVLSYDVH